MRKGFIFAVLAVLLFIFLAACERAPAYDAAEPEYEAYEAQYPEYEEIDAPYAGDEAANLAPQEPVHPLDGIPHGAIAVAYIEFMSDNLYERLPFTYREKEAALWIAEELLAMGYSEDSVEIQSFYHNDPVVRERLWADMSSTITWWGRGVDVPLRDYSQNVILTVPGQSERTIIVGAHYDTLPYPGASDNASGVALLLESAQRMLGADNYHTIIYVFFGAEEIGLVGARVFYSSLSQRERDNIVMMINADVLFEGEFFLYGAGYADWDGPDFVPGSNDVSQQVSAIAQEMRSSHGMEIATVPEAILLSSDQLVFLWEGHTVVMLFGVDLLPRAELEGGQWIWGAYGDYMLVPRVLHSARDDFHYINAAWPGKIENAMWTFSLFLEGILTDRF